MNIPDGQLWSFLRNVLTQGMAICQDDNAGKFLSYEHLSARLDEAARERVDELVAKYTIHAAVPPMDKAEGVKCKTCDGTRMVGNPEARDGRPVDFIDCHDCVGERCDCCGGPKGDCGCAMGYADAIASRRDRHSEPLAPEGVRFAGNLAPMMNRAMRADEKVGNTPAPTGQGEPIGWMIVNKSGGREARVTYEPSFDVLADLDMRRPADAPHRTVPLYLHPSPAVAEVAAELEALTWPGPNDRECIIKSSKLRALASRLRGGT